MSELRNLILQMIRNNTPITIRQGVVKSVDNTADTCVVEPTNSGANFLDVKLRSIIKAPTSNSSKIVVYPKVGSVVLIGIADNDARNAFVIEVSEIESISVEILPDFKLYLKSDKTVELDSPKITINQGTNGGLIKISDLVTKLNKIEDDLNSLKSKFTAWAPVPNDGGAALKTITASWAGQTFTPTTIANLENIKVKH